MCCIPHNFSVTSPTTKQQHIPSSSAMKLSPSHICSPPRIRRGTTGRSLLLPISIRTVRSSLSGASGIERVSFQFFEDMANILSSAEADIQEVCIHIHWLCCPMFAYIVLHAHLTGVYFHRTRSADSIGTSWLVSWTTIRHFSYFTLSWRCEPIRQQLDLGHHLLMKLLPVNLFLLQHLSTPIFLIAVPQSHFPTQCIPSNPIPIPFLPPSPPQALNPLNFLSV